MSLALEILHLLICYIVGAIPTGLILGLRLRGIDVRQHGSKNIGTTNTWRVLGWKLGVTTLLIDVGKAWFVVAYGHDLLVGEGGRVLPIPLELSGLAVLLGNFFNVFLGFKGGKGVATSLGVFLALAPAAVLVALGVFLASLAVSRYVSLSSILAAVAFPIMVLYTSGLSAMLLLAVVIATVVIVKHRANITRLMNGTENRIGSGTRKEKA